GTVAGGAVVARLPGPGIDSPVAADRGHAGPRGVAEAARIGQAYGARGERHPALAPASGRHGHARLEAVARVAVGAVEVADALELARDGAAGARAVAAGSVVAVLTGVDDAVAARRGGAGPAVARSARRPDVAWAAFLRWVGRVRARVVRTAEVLCARVAVVA